MIDEEIDPSPEYVKGFNAGHTLAQHEPELLKSTIASIKERPTANA
jgi:hypothetical protein